MTQSEKCMVPPKGWRCTREKGHDGPCAAVKVDYAAAIRNIAAFISGDEESTAQPSVSDHIADASKMIPSDCHECGGSSTSKGKFACICDHIGDANEMISDHIPDAKQMVPSERAREIPHLFCTSCLSPIRLPSINAWQMVKAVCDSARSPVYPYDELISVQNINAYISALEAEFVTREADFEILKTYAETMAEKCDALQASVTRLTEERDELAAKVQELEVRDVARLDIIDGWEHASDEWKDLAYKYKAERDAATKRADDLQASIDCLIRDTCEDDTDIRNLCRPFLTEQTCDHDGYALVPIQGAVANVIDVLKKRAEAAERERDEWIAKWTATAKERNDSEALVREVAEFGCLFITPSPSGEQCGCIHCKCRAFVAKEQA